MSELPELPDFCWPVDTSCCTRWDEWLVEPDPEADPPVEGVPLYSEAVKARAVSLAGSTLRMLTGYRVGGCPVTVRPCRAGCAQQTQQHGVPWTPALVSGTWLNIACGCGGACACSSRYNLQLQGPVGAITEVRIDGTVLDPAAYRLDSGGILVRVDGDTWPSCQDLAAPLTEEGTWSVTYVPGALVDGHGAFAAGILACEYLSACTDGSCRLDARVQQVTRQGVTLILDQGLFPGGLTGIREVDTYITRWNPHGLTVPSMVWSPDVNRGRRMTTVTGWNPPSDTIDGGTP